MYNNMHGAVMKSARPNEDRGIKITHVTSHQMPVALAIGENNRDSQ